MESGFGKGGINSFIKKSIRDNFFFAKILINFLSTNWRMMMLELMRIETIFDLDV